MTIRIITRDEDFQQVQEFKNILTIEFENQEDLNNGMWLHLIGKDEKDDCSVEFDPKTEWFDIFEEK